MTYHGSVAYYDHWTRNEEPGFVFSSHRTLTAHRAITVSALSKYMKSPTAYGCVCWRQNSMRDVPVYFPSLCCNSLHLQRDGKAKLSIMWALCNWVSIHRNVHSFSLW